MTYRDAVARISSLDFAGVKLGLENITRLCDALGNPQSRFLSVHVAGTNGKGSVCALIDSILRAAGYRVGRFTSPHLRDFRERIHMNGRPISRKRVARFIEQRWPLITRGGYSYFETATALAFEAFADASLDIAVVEVGLGGRLDATNILPSSLSIITRIARDHERFLGKTPEQIAREKAGIIRRGTPVLTGPLVADAESVIAQIAEERHAPLWTAAEILTDSRSTSLLPTGDEHLRLPLPGAHQMTNLAVALAAVRLLEGVGISVGKAALTAGVRQAHWPGRFQIATGHPSVVYDAAHNLDSIRVVVQTWRKVFGAQRAVVLFTTREDKDYAAMVEALSPLMCHWVGCPMPTVRGIDENAMSLLAENHRRPFTWRSSPRRALRAARELAGADGHVLVVGSHFLVGAVIPEALMDKPNRGNVFGERVTRRGLLQAAGTTGRPF